MVRLLSVYRFGYLFTLMHGRLDARAFFDAIVGTIDLRPEAAAAL